MHGDILIFKYVSTEAEESLWLYFNPPQPTRTFSIYKKNIHNEKFIAHSNVVVLVMCY